MPTVIPYFIAFWWINGMKAKYPYVVEVPALSNSPSNNNNYLSMTEDEEIV